MTYQISLLPLTSELHGDALQEVYANTPAYWAMYNLPAVPAGQAMRDLREAAETPGRTMMGIIKPIEDGQPAAGGELIGLVDFRLHWPGARMAYIGMILVAEPLQRQGVGTQAWQLLAGWLQAQVGIERVRVGVEQFNVAALPFFQQLGFSMTGESNRVKSGDKLVRLLYMEQEFSIDN
jgi:RimJ/RimL family protein N-acetyltransferase